MNPAKRRYINCFFGGERRTRASEGVGGGSSVKVSTKSGGSYLFVSYSRGESPIFSRSFLMRILFCDVAFHFSFHLLWFNLVIYYYRYFHIQTSSIKCKYPILIVHIFLSQHVHIQYWLRYLTIYYSASWAIGSEAMRARGIIVLVKSK